MGCDVYASDLNPIACLLTWGAFNIIGASPEKRAEIERAQKEVDRNGLEARPGNRVRLLGKPMDSHRDPWTNVGTFA